MWIFLEWLAGAFALIAAVAFLVARTKRDTTWQFITGAAALYALYLVTQAANADKASRQETDRARQQVIAQNRLRKATADVSAASSIGGFSDNEKRLYANGILHIEHNHRNAGSYTIQQVLDSEETREAEGDAERRQKQQVAASQHTERADANEKATVKVALGAIQQSAQGNALLRGYGISDNTMTIQVDADIWGPMSEQDKTMFKRTMWKVFAMAYKENHGDDGRSLILRITDLNDNQVDSYY
jgi:hypothetical protein